MPRTPALAAFVATLTAFVATSSALPRARAEEIAPTMYAAGNLRVAVTCAGDLITPKGGLRVVLDEGAPLEPFKTNTVSGYGYDENGNAFVTTSISDSGFLAPPGRRRVRLLAPDCAAQELDVDVSATHETRIEATLPIVTESLRGPVGAPDGFGLVVGGFSTSFPGSIAHGSEGDPSYGSSHTVDHGAAHGVFLAELFERRNLVVANEMAFGWGHYEGTVAPNRGPVGPFAMSGSLFRMAATLHIGVRLPLHDVALAAGSGIGGSLWILGVAHLDPGVDHPEDVRAANMSDLHAIWHVPLWASVTWKPVCDFGVQLGASYDVEPTNFDANTLSLSAGLLIQPSRACREPPSMNVTP